MSVQTEIDRIITAVGAAYDTVEAKGGTAPAAQTIEGLAGAISGIKSAPATPYMEAEYVEESSLYGEYEYIAHKIRSAKLYNHTAIYANEFNNQTQLRNLDCSDASNHITTIEYEAFLGTFLGDIQLPATITALQIHCFANATITTLVIPPLVSELPTRTFSGICRAVDTQTGVETPINIVLPSNLTKIGRSCFEFAGIAHIDIPNTVTEIGESAFTYCQDLASIILPPSLQAISNDMLSDCISLTSITIPESVTAIGASAFSNSGLTSITIPSTVTTLGSSAFANCKSLTSMDIQANVTVIPDNFAPECPLTSLILPNTVQTIGESAFVNVQTLQITELTIPASVIFIGNNAFNSNNAVQMTLTVLPTTPPTFGGEAFNLATGSVIKVPAASVAAYKAADGWKDYASYIVAM